MADKTLLFDLIARDKASPAFKSAGKSADGMKGSLKDLVKDGIGKLSPELAAAQGHLSSIKGGFSGASSGAAALAGGAIAAAGAVAAFAIKGVNSFTDLAAQVRQFQRVSGATAEESSRLIDVTELYGISADQAAAATFKLSQNIAKHADVLKADGIAVAKNKDGTTDLTGTILNVADAYKNTHDQVARNKLVMDAFGKSGAALIPLLDQGRESIEAMFKETDKHHELLSQKDLDKAEDYRIAMHDLGEAVSGLEMELGQALVPALSASAKGLTKLVDAVDPSINAVEDSTNKWIKLFRTLDIAPEVGDKIHDFLFGAKDDTEATTEATKSWKAILGLVPNAVDKVSDAVHNQKVQLGAAHDAIQEYRDSVKDATDALEKLADATLASFDADLRYTKSLLDTSDALKEYNAAHLYAVALHHKNEDANRAETDAIIKAKEAILDEAAASADAAAQKAQMAGVTLTAAQKAAYERAELEKIRDTLKPGSELRKALDEYIFKLASIPTAVKTSIETTYIVGSPTTGRAALRASGGPVVAGAPYWVGDSHGMQNAELFVPSKSGAILTKSEAERALTGSGGGGDIHIHTEGLTADQAVDAANRYHGWYAATSGARS